MPKRIESIVESIDSTIEVLIDDPWRFLSGVTPLSPSRVIVNPRPTGIDVVRADDLLVLSFDFTNFNLDDNDNPRFIRVNDPDPALLQITFQPQSFAEAAFPVDDDGTPAPAAPPVNCAMANTSQISFNIPENVKFIKLDALGDLLDWTRYQLRVAAGGLDPGPSGGPSDDTVTLIEAPYGLILTPDGSATWSHSEWPVEQNGVTELWHSILNADKLAAIFAGAQVTDSTGAQVAGGQVNDKEFPDGALLLTDRQNLKTQSSESLQTGEGAIQSRRFMLSSLGAFFDLHGEWPQEALEEWEHRATMGRDQYVRTVHKGYLYPFGHRASLIAITERRLTPWINHQPADDGGPLYLFTNTYLVVRERVKSYDVHQIPFQQVECLTRVTPKLDNGDASWIWPKVNKTDLLFHFVGTDVDGQQTSFTSPVIFVDLTKPPVDTEDVKNAFKGVESNLGGQPITFGDGTLSPSQKTVLHTMKMSFNGAFTGAGVDQNVTPYMVDAQVRVPAVTHLLGSDQPRKIRLSDNFTQQTAGKSQDLSVFAEFLDGPIDFKFNSNDQSGGLLQPDMALGSLSHQYGPMVGSPADFTDNWDFANFFDQIKLLGSISLAGIIDGTQSSGAPPAILAAPAKTTMYWSPSLKDSGLFIANKNVPPDPNAAATLVLNITKTIGPPDATTASCALGNFQLSLFGIITVAFDSLTFVQQTGQKPAITATVNSVKFGGPLGFLNGLTPFIPSDGFSNPPALEITPQGAQLGYSLALPPITVGAFALQNIDLGASLQIPFQGDPVALFFHFATPEKPFLLTVDGICGGGYFNIDVTAHGVQSLNVALEFGGNLALDLGVASGGVTITGGFHFGYHLDSGKQVLDFTAFVQASGYLEVLGMVTVSTEFYVGLTYTKGDGTPVFSGTAIMTVAVDVLFFHDSVDLTMSESFRAEGVDPNFTDQINQDEWNYYCSCFAVAA